MDDQMRGSNVDPGATVDRDGSLANHAELSTSPSLPITTQLVTRPHLTYRNLFNSCSDPTGAVPMEGSSRSAKWTTEIRPELIAAAVEEAHLALAGPPTSFTSAVPTRALCLPQHPLCIPPAPALPQHLDKLILNVRPSAVVSLINSSAGTTELDRRRGTREKKHQRRHRKCMKEGRRTQLGMT